MNASFERLAPYLKDPLVLIGFFLLIAFSFCRYLVKQRIIPPLPKALGYQILRLILLYGFIIGLLLIFLGFALKRQELINQHRAAENIELTLRDALKQATWLSEEKKNEIVQQIIEAYRSGALSKEQVEKKVEEIKVTFTRTNNPPAPGLSNQFHSVNKADAKTNSPPLTSQPEIDNLSFKQSVEPMAGAETQSPVSQSDKTRVQNESLTNANVIILPHIDISKNNELRRGAGKGDILIGSNLVKGFDMFVESSQTKRDWLTQEPNSMKMAFPADQD